MILVIDNYDSFTYNLVQYLRVLGAEVTVRRNDQVDVSAALTLGFSHLVISPGPGHPSEAGVSEELIRASLGRTPILGVCLGHQALADVLGGTVDVAPEPVHGKASKVRLTARGREDPLFAGVDDVFDATRYHSLFVGETEAYQTLAATEDGTIMAIKDPVHPAYGLQFHPESILTGPGMRILENFLNLR